MNFNDLITYIKQNVNILDYINKHYPELDFKRSGNVYISLCPFHNDSKPSFVIFPNTNTFKCFGCGIHGDLIQFVQDYMNKDHSIKITKKEAIKEICTNLNIKISRDNPDKIKYLKTMTSYCNRYIKNLKYSDRALNYLTKDRKLKLEVIKKFGLGYVSTEEKRYREKFYAVDRISFPIISNNYCLGMGYRCITPADPKYWNDKNNDYFTKGNYFFGLHETGKYIKESNFGIVVEGYTDVMYLYQSDIRNVVSTMGTAFTENQMILLSRYTKNILLFLDNDDAGNNNILRVLPMLLKLGFNVKIIVNSDGLDPGDLCIREEFNRDKIIDYLNKNSVYGIQYIFNKEVNRYEDIMINTKRQILENVTPILNNITNENDRLLYNSLLKKKLDL